jgi:hypothetical protein
MWFACPSGGSMAMALQSGTSFGIRRFYFFSDFHFLVVLPERRAFRPGGIFNGFWF